MSTAQVALISAGPATPPGRAQVARITATISHPDSTVQVSLISGRASSTATAQVSEISATAVASGTLQARAGADRAGTPFLAMTLDGSASTGSITGATWRQIPNGAPTLSGFPVSQLTTSFQPPATTTGCTLLFELQITDGSSTAVDTVTITVAPWWLWTLVGTTWVPTAEYVLADGFYPDSGLYPDTGLFLRI